MKAVFTVVERSPGKSYWIRVGVGFVNRDGSITLKLDAVPVNGTLQVREWESGEDFQRRMNDHESPPAPARPRARRDDASVTAPIRRPSDGVDGIL